ncbi:diguanylate cyclase [Cupriavidus sp. AU9028]|uniref:GGDEF domain-containing protein n=1 Tax=Cupriavidus sp. AU9028 TaxID=2871157 RepID=UPI001C9894FC|nr:sensor domain-containing diguanylate cyclase [Cupriavidus sp. AU9028]MBY4897565.1 sensor domain-containing diguanylate cyclase [Cupriavidus sp. AU9028]
MIPAPIPANEPQRLSALRSLNLLDSDVEERFDRITRLARRLFDVPIAVVSLVDADRQWFKSSYGMAVRETPREHSFCAHAILEQNVMVVPDATQDARFHDSPLVTGKPHVRFYAGCPLTAGQGATVGTLCLMDDKPRKMDDHDQALLRDLARLVEQELVATQLASMDDLTHLSNRRGFTMLGERALETCRRHQWTAALLFFDLDQFKPINDRYGHAEGDRALQGFANLLRANLRYTDVIGRIGGDEFVVLLVATTPAGTENMIERLRESLDTYNRDQQRGYELRFSVGAVSFDPARHALMADLLAEGDQQMYRNKRERRADTSGQ